MKLSRYIRESSLARARADGQQVNDLTNQLADVVAQLRHQLTNS